MPSVETRTAMQELKRTIASTEMSASQIDDLAGFLGLHPKDEASEILRVAASFGRVGALEWALQWLQAPPLTTDSRGRSILHLAVGSRRHDTVRWMLLALTQAEQPTVAPSLALQLYKLRDSDGRHALAIAAERDDVPMVHALLPAWTPEYASRRRCYVVKASLGMNGLFGQSTQRPADVRGPPLL